MSIVLQFGTSRFLQAHADLFISEAMAEGRALGPVTVVQSSGDPARRKRLEALAAPGGYPVLVKGIENGVPVEREVRVTAIARALTTETDWPEIVRIAVEEAQVILSNTGDAGWKPQADDALPCFSQAMSYPAKLTQLLFARFQAGGQKLTVMPAELIARNGETLRARVLELSAPLSADFAAWVSESVVFANSLVDRIVSEPLEPAGAVAEPYALWAIEDAPNLTLPCTHPAIQLVPDLGRIEKLKLHILNLGHTYLVARWLARGGERDRLVRDEIADAAIRADLADLYEKEVLPTFLAAGYGDEAKDYVATTLERFANPFLVHRLSDIAQNHGEKTQRRIGAFIDWGRALGVTGDQPRLRRIVEEEARA
ncbi:mannitol dehydrogenase family protein [Martelella mediterranea]|uniref:mannitol dehydrogenase family protein n=1 Tax=Martelella mediterranea TaxID=293089 RepID=UPI001E346CC3|nr:mannitol dehydrogenase family protein [Martelella mediterranea]MCD1634785.1 mannitol dehydrogenase family protein [Martelella mediterranea]